MNMLKISEAMRNGETISVKTQMKLVVSLSVPAILEQLVMTLMSYIDTAMVGSLGYEATAAIGVVASTVWLLNGIVNAAAVGFSVQVAQYLGAGREQDSRNVLCQAILFNAVFGVGLAVFAVAFGQILPGLLGAGQSVRPYARDYFCVIGALLPFNMACAMYSSIFRCSGNVLLPSLMNVGMCLLDIVFNFFLIYPSRQIGGFTVWGAGLGVKGAALGTGLAQVCVGLALLVLLVRKQGPLRLRGGEKWRFTKVCMHNAFVLATPAALERTTLCLAQIVMTSVVTAMGPVSVAANYVAVQTESICYLPAYGVAAAATALVGQSIGAGRADMAKRFAYGTTAVGFALVTVTGTLLFLCAPSLTRLLTPETEVINLSTRVLRIVAFSEPLFAVSIVVIGALRGAGDGKGPFLINLCSMWGIRVLTVLLFTRSYGLVGVWATMTVELVCRGCFFLVRLVRGRWVRTAALS
ncbi:MAG: MATE family efflux transporter [Eubacteriales bacterium]|nr:MATE family efflux transporter [Eubacteriales bacterium]